MPYEKMLFHLVITIGTFNRNWDLVTNELQPTPRGRLEFVGYKVPITVECPDCDYKVEQHLLIRHLIVDHGYDAFDAGELAGEICRGTWSPSEEQLDGAEDRI